MGGGVLKIQFAEKIEVVFLNSHHATWKRGDNMATGPPRQKVKVLQKLDIAILKDLYDFRALSTAQISEFHQITKLYTYRKLNILRNTGYTITVPIKGSYIPGQSRQGNYHRISETGIACLRKQGYPVERNANSLRVSRFHLPYVLTTNDILLNMKHAGWRIQDSREVKKQFCLNRSMNIQGTLESPNGKGYAFYTFTHSTSAKNMEKVIGEIEQYPSSDKTAAGERYFDNFLFFTNGKKSFTKVIGKLQERPSILKTESMKVLPQTFGIKYLVALEGSENKFHSCLEQAFPRELKLFSMVKKPMIHSNHPEGFNQIVQYKGEEKYLMNLLDTDMIKVKHIVKYRKNQYERNGRKVLVVTHPNIRAIHETLLKDIHHVEFLEVEPDFI